MKKAVLTVSCVFIVVYSYKIRRKNLLDAIVVLIQALIRSPEYAVYKKCRMVASKIIITGTSTRIRAYAVYKKCRMVQNSNSACASLKLQDMSCRHLPNPVKLPTYSKFTMCNV